MSDFWTQLIQYTNNIENETPDIDNPEHLLSKLLIHAEQERQILEAQVKTDQFHFHTNIFLVYSSIQPPQQHKKLAR